MLFTKYTLLLELFKLFLAFSIFLSSYLFYYLGRLSGSYLSQTQSFYVRARMNEWTVQNTGRIPRSLPGVFDEYVAVYPNAADAFVYCRGAVEHLVGRQFH